MIEWKPKLWVGLGAAALSLGAVSCGPSGEAGSGEAGAGEAGSAATAATSGEAATGETGGESGGGESGGAGEAGAADAYANVPAGSKLGLQIAHLAGFARIAERVAAEGDAAAASILISQGLLEVHQPFQADYQGKAAAIAPAYQAVIAALDAGKPKAEIDAAFKAARSAEAAASAEAGADPVAVVKGMLSIGTGLYSLVNTPQGPDPIEYQHALGALLAASEALATAQPALSTKNQASTLEAETAMAALLALFTSTAAPETPPSGSEVLAAAARVELPLSDLSR